MIDIVIIYLLLGAIAIVVSILGWYFYRLQNRKTKESSPKQKPSFESILDVLKDRNSTQNELESAILSIKEHYPNIEAESSLHFSAISLITKHKNTTSKLIIEFGKFLKQNNPSYKKEIDLVEKKALEQR